MHLEQNIFSQDLQLHPLPPECSEKSGGADNQMLSCCQGGGNVTWQLVLSHQRVCFILCF